MKKSMMILFIFSIASLVLFVSQANAWKLTISEEGKTHTLTGNLDCTGDNGIRITADDVTLDGDGYEIFGSDIGTGISVKGQSGITIKGCKVRNFKNGIFLENSNECTVEGNTVSAIVYRHIRIRKSSNCLVEYNTVDGSGLADQSIQSGLCVESSTAMNNEVRFNNLKNCGTKVARDSGIDSYWHENYYDDAIDWDCDGRAVYIIGHATPLKATADLNAYIEESGWEGLSPYVDEDGDGYGQGCQLGTDRNDHTSMINAYKEKVFDNLQADDLDWEYICRPWWYGVCDNVNVSIVPFLGPSAQSLEVAIPVVDTTGFNYSQYIDIFYVDDEAKKKEGSMDWSRYHTMTFWVYPVSTVSQITHLNIRIDNDPTCRDDLTYPTTLFADGCREIQKRLILASNTWNKVVLDLTQNDYAGGLYTKGTPRPTTIDDIKSVRFFFGRDPQFWVDDQAVTFYIDDIRLLSDLKEKNNNDY